MALKYYNKEGHLQRVLKHRSCSKESLCTDRCHINTCMDVTCNHLVALWSSAVAQSEEITLIFTKDSPKNGVKFMWKGTEKIDRNKHSPGNKGITVIQQICRNDWEKQVCAKLGKKKTHRLDNQSINCNKQTLWTRNWSQIKDLKCQLAFKYYHS